MARNRSDVPHERETHQRAPDPREPPPLPPDAEGLERTRHFQVVEFYPRPRASFARYRGAARAGWGGERQYVQSPGRVYDAGRGPRQSLELFLAKKTLT